MCIIMFIGALLLSVAVKAQQAPTAGQVLAEATATAAKENKKVFLIWHASWCHWCHKMDTAMNDATCKNAFSSNYVVRHITINESASHKAEENAGGVEMLAKYKGLNQGIPFWIIFDSNGEMLGNSLVVNEKGRVENMGYPDGRNLDFFIMLLKKTSGMNGEELQAVKKRFSNLR